MKVLVCGGRKFGDLLYSPGELQPLQIKDRENEYFSVWDNLAYILLPYDASDIMIIQGGGKGADKAAKDFAIDRRYKMKEYKANWDLYGRKAGPLRNDEMLLEKPDLVVAFPGGRGTADMVHKAKQAGIKVIEINYRV